MRLVVYVTDMFRFRPLVNKVQEELWGKGPYPPRTIIEIDRLNQDDIVEVEGTFYAPVRRATSGASPQVDTEREALFRESFSGSIAADRPAGSSRPPAVEREFPGRQRRPHGGAPEFVISQFCLIEDQTSRGMTRQCRYTVLLPLKASLSSEELCHAYLDRCGDSVPYGGLNEHGLHAWQAEAVQQAGCGWPQMI